MGYAWLFELYCAALRKARDVDLSLKRIFSELKKEGSVGVKKDEMGDIRF